MPHSRVGAVDRTVDREQGTVDRAVDRPESNLLSGLVRSTGRLTGRLTGQKFDRWSIGRPPKSREQLCFPDGRPPGRPCLAYGRPSGRPPPPESGGLAVGRPHNRPAQVPAQRAQVCARRSTGPVDRLWVRSTVPVDRQNLAEGILGQKNLIFLFLKNPIKFLKFHKNSFMIIH